MFNGEVGCFFLQLRKKWLVTKSPSWLCAQGRIKVVVTWFLAWCLKPLHQTDFLIPAIHFFKICLIFWSIETASYSGESLTKLRQVTLLYRATLTATAGTKWRVEVEKQSVLTWCHQSKLHPLSSLQPKCLLHMNMLCFVESHWKNLLEKAQLKPDSLWGFTCSSNH